MLMSKVIAAMLALALVCGALFGRMPEVSLAGISGAKDAVQLVLSIGGAMCLWSGLMEVMDRSGLSAAVARLLQPLITLLFGKYGKDERARQAISQNMAANILGLGSAATPAGLKAAERLHELSLSHGEAPDAVFLLVVINTCSVQLLPTTVAAVRMGLGSARPFDILPAVWLASVVALLAGVFAAKSLKAGWREK